VWAVGRVLTNREVQKNDTAKSQSSSLIVNQGDEWSEPSSNTSKEILEISTAKCQDQEGRFWKKVPETQVLAVLVHPQKGVRLNCQCLDTGKYLSSSGGVFRRGRPTSEFCGNQPNTIEGQTGRACFKACHQLNFFVKNEQRFMESGG